MDNIEKYKEFLMWLITPQNDAEQQAFKDNNMVDYYINIVNNISDMSSETIKQEINSILISYGMNVNIEEIIEKRC